MAKRGRGEGLGVHVEGLPELRRALKKIDKNLDRDLARELRRIGKGVRDRSRREAAEFKETGELERSIKLSVRARSSSVYSNLDYAPVHEWGGTIQPRGVPINIPRREFLSEGVRRSRGDIQRGLEGLLDAIADTWDDRI